MTWSAERAEVSTSFLPFPAPETPCPRVPWRRAAGLIKLALSPKAKTSWPQDYSMTGLSQNKRCTESFLHIEDMVKWKRPVVLWFCLVLTISSYPPLALGFYFFKFNLISIVCLCVHMRKHMLGLARGGQRIAFRVHSLLQCDFRALNSGHEACVEPSHQPALISPPENPQTLAGSCGSMVEQLPSLARVKLWILSQLVKEQKRMNE